MGVYTDMDLDDLMKENIKLTRENNKLLKKMRRSQLMTFWMKVLFFLLILGVPYFIYKYYLEESFHDLKDSYGDIKTEISEAKHLKEKLPF